MSLATKPGPLHKAHFWKAQSNSWQSLFLAETSLLPWKFVPGVSFYLATSLPKPTRMWQPRVSKKRGRSSIGTHGKAGDWHRKFQQKEVLLLHCHTASTTSTCLLLPALWSNSSLPWRPAGPAVLQQHTENCSCNCLQTAESTWSMHGNYSVRQQSYYRLSSHFSKTL